MSQIARVLWSIQGGESFRDSMTLLACAQLGGMAIYSYTSSKNQNPMGSGKEIEPTVAKTKYTFMSRRYTEDTLRY